MIEVKEIDEGKWGLYLDGVLLGDSKNRYEADHAKQILLRYLQKHRRMQQVRLTDWAVRALVVVTFFASFAAPSRWMFPLVLVCFAVVGLWAMLYPEGVLGWAKTAHPGIDVNDRSIWWLPRLIGAFFLIFVVVLAVAFRGRW